MGRRVDGNSIKHLAHELRKVWILSRTAEIYNSCFAKIFCFLKNIRLSDWKVCMVCSAKNPSFLLLDKFTDCEKLLMFILLKLFSLYFCLPNQVKKSKKQTKKKIQISHFPSEVTLFQKFFFSQNTFRKIKSFQYKQNNLPSLKRVLTK